MIPSHEYLRIYMPYVVQPTSKGWVLLNRKYKPLGLSTSDSVDYEEYAVRLKGLGPKKRAEIQLYSRPDGFLYLYSDGCSPWLGEKEYAAYMTRFNLLASCKPLRILNRRGNGFLPRR